jgi:hypothetical protein
MTNENQEVKTFEYDGLRIVVDTKSKRWQRFMLWRAQNVSYYNAIQRDVLDTITRAVGCRSGELTQFMQEYFCDEFRTRFYLAYFENKTHVDVPTLIRDSMKYMRKFM